jgi:PhnB protein
MKALNVYLTFDGNAKDAMTFYQQTFGGDLQVMPFSAAQGMPIPPGAENRTMHATLSNGKMMLMASDTMAGMPLERGVNNYTLNVDCDDVAEQDKLWAALSGGGKVNMPLQDTFWGARFGMCIDRFGIAWMLNCEKKS